MYSSQVASIAALIGLVIFIHNQASDTDVTLAARHVLQTLFWSLSISTGLIATCVTTAFAFGKQMEIVPGTELAACAPYGMVASPITARVHIFNMGGYTDGEWAVIQDSPRLAVRAVGDAIDRVIGVLRGGMENAGTKEL